MDPSPLGWSFTVNTTVTVYDLGVFGTTPWMVFLRATMLAFGTAAAPC